MEVQDKQGLLETMGPNKITQGVSLGREEGGVQVRVQDGAWDPPMFRC